jgi:hypothetical protein
MALLLSEPVLGASVKFESQQLRTVLCNYVALGQFELARGCCISFRAVDPTEAQDVLQQLADGKAPKWWPSVQASPAYVRWWGANALREWFDVQVCVSSGCKFPRSSNLTLCP